MIVFLRELALVQSLANLNAIMVEITGKKRKKTMRTKPSTTCQLSLYLKANIGFHLLIGKNLSERNKLNNT